MARKNIEDAIQRDLMLWIKREHPYLKAFATRNEDSRKRSEEIEVGLPDVIIRWEQGGIRHLFYLEIKRKKGRLSENQKQWIKDNSLLANEYYAVAYGLEECKQAINAIEYPKKEAPKGKGA